ncbi:hypothetical protein II582_01135 [bacterium]|nr:hypothetical protein [bacterium]
MKCIGLVNVSKSSSSNVTSFFVHCSNTTSSTIPDKLATSYVTSNPLRIISSEDDFTSKNNTSCSSQISNVFPEGTVHFVIVTHPISTLVMCPSFVSS